MTFGLLFDRNLRVEIFAGLRFVLVILSKFALISLFRFRHGLWERVFDNCEVSVALSSCKVYSSVFQQFFLLSMICEGLLTFCSFWGAIGTLRSGIWGVKSDCLFLFRRQNSYSTISSLLLLWLGLLPWVFVSFGLIGKFIWNWTFPCASFAILPETRLLLLGAFAIHQELFIYFVRSNSQNLFP